MKEEILDKNFADFPDYSDIRADIIAIGVGGYKQMWSNLPTGYFHNSSTNIGVVCTAG